MINQQLTDYIQKARAAGQTDEQIAQTLVQQGWQQADIQTALANNQPAATSGQLPPLPQNPSAVKKLIHSLLLIILYVIVFGVINSLLNLPIFFIRFFTDPRGLYEISKLLSKPLLTLVIPFSVALFTTPFIVLSLVNKTKVFSALSPKAVKTIVIAISILQAVRLIGSL